MVKILLKKLRVTYEVTYEIYLIDYRLQGDKNGIDAAIGILKVPFSSYTIYHAFEHLHSEISKNLIFIDKNIQVLLEPIKR
jgi:hypothetical protein